MNKKRKLFRVKTYKNTGQEDQEVPLTLFHLKQKNDGCAIQVHRYYLFLSFNGSSIINLPGNPGGPLIFGIINLLLG